MITWFKKRFFRGKINVPDAACGRADEAVTATEKAVVGARNRERGDALRKEGKLDAAVQWYRKAIAVNGQDAEAHNMLGDIFYERQALGEAEACYRSAVGIRPDFTDAQINLGLTLDEQGRFAEAEVCYRRVLEYRPDTALVHFNLGVTLKSQGRLAEAEASFRRVLEIKPNFSVAYFNLGIMQQQQGRLAEAESSYRCALEIRPDYAEARDALLNLIMAQGRLSEVEEIYRQVLESTPNDAVTHYNLGVTLNEQHRQAEGEMCYRRALEIKPDFPEAHGNLGSLLKQQGLLDQAEASYRCALEINPNFADVHSNLGVVLREQGRTAEAEISYRRALEVGSCDVNHYCNLGILLHEQGRYSEAEACYRRALEINPASANVHNELGNTLRIISQLTAAEACYRLALQIRPDSAEVHNNLGVVLNDQGSISEAEASFRYALTINPDYAQAHDNKLFALNYQDKSAAEIFAAHREYGDRFGWIHGGAWPPHGNDRTTNRRLKIGYVSPDFRNHAVAHFFSHLIEQHDKERFEVFCYYNHTQRDEFTQRIESAADHWIPCSALSDERLAQRICDDRIDILIDLAGHTAGNRLLVFALKPAPIQITYLGYPNTSGLPTMDYRISDQYADVEGSDAYYSEKLLRMPDSLWCYQWSSDMPSILPAPSIKNGYVTFGSFNSFNKINGQCIELWAGMLRAIPSARLLMVTVPEGEVRQRVTNQFSSLGVAPERLEFYGKLPLKAFQKMFQKVDVTLDPVVVNGATTTCESLWMGVPVLTLKGGRFLSRAGFSILSAAGLEEFVADSAQEFILLAVRLASDIPRLAEIHDGLHAKVAASPLTDVAAFCKNLENKYQEVWKTWCEQ